MRWEGREQSTHIDDRRGLRVPGGRGTGFGCKQGLQSGDPATRDTFKASRL